ncbi:hypothetical protein HYX00_01490 [Candidatus Woesearchaeota archaeon]|nr:hypothetical protein [Candidatus Woesearchaeota archaeon]
MQTKLTQHKGIKELAIKAFIPVGYRIDMLKKKEDAKRSFQCDFNESTLQHWQKQA